MELENNMTKKDFKKIQSLNEIKFDTDDIENEDYKNKNKNKNKNGEVNENDNHNETLNKESINLKGYIGIII